MPSTLLRLAVALLTFGLGVTATTLWISYSTPDFKKLEAVPHHAPPLPPLPPLPTVEEPPPPAPVMASLSGDIVNYNVRYMPMPAYPPMAKGARASGEVVVHIVMGGTGQVVEATVVSGPPLLERVALQAAYQLRFEPPLFAGRMGEVSGTITYNFVPQ